MMSFEVSDRTTIERAHETIAYKRSIRRCDHTDPGLSIRTGRSQPVHLLHEFCDAAKEGIPIKLSCRRPPGPCEDSPVKTCLCAAFPPANPPLDPNKLSASSMKIIQGDNRLAKLNRALVLASD
jgi:hypothetical protein